MHRSLRTSSAAPEVWLNKNHNKSGDECSKMETLQQDITFKTKEYKVNWMHEMEEPNVFNSVDGSSQLNIVTAHFQKETQFEFIWWILAQHAILPNFHLCSSMDQNDCMCSMMMYMQFFWRISNFGHQGPKKCIIGSSSAHKLGGPHVYYTKMIV